MGKKKKKNKVKKKEKKKKKKKTKKKKGGREKGWGGGGKAGWKKSKIRVHESRKTGEKNYKHTIHSAIDFLRLSDISLEYA